MKETNTWERSTDNPRNMKKTDNSLRKNGGLRTKDTNNIILKILFPPFMRRFPQFISKSFPCLGQVSCLHIRRKTVFSSCWY